MHIVLAAHGPDSCARTPDLAAEESQSGTGLDVIRAADVLGDAHGIEKSGCRRLCINPGGIYDLGDSNPRLFRRFLKGIVQQALLEILESNRPGVDELQIRQSLVYDDLHHTPEKIDIRAWIYAKMDVRHPGGRGDPGVGYNHFCPFVLGLLGPAGDDRMRLGEVGADGKDALRVFQIQQVVGHGSGAKRRSKAHYGRRMAEPGAVVHIRRTQEAGHLLHEVVLLVIAAGRCQEAQRFWPVLAEIPGKPLRHQVQSFIPCYRNKPVANLFQGILQPLFMVQDLQESIALGTERPLASGVIGHIFDTLGYALIDFQIEATAHSAVGTEGRN